MEPLPRRSLSAAVHCHEPDHRCREREAAGGGGHPRPGEGGSGPTGPWLGEANH